MDTEALEIRQHLAREKEIRELYWFRSSAVEIYRRNGALHNRLEEGDIFGHFSLLRNRGAHFPVKAIEDTLVYLIPDEVFQHLCASDEQIADFVELVQPRLKTVVEKRASDDSIMTTRVRWLGLRTDSDFRSRVVAEGLAPDTPVGQVVEGIPFGLADDPPCCCESMILALAHSVARGG